MQSIKRLIAPFFNLTAWMLILVGGMLFAARVQFTADHWVNLPELATVIQLCGGLFMLLGFQVIASILFWPAANVGDLMTRAQAGSVPAAIVLFGLKVFNGLTFIGFAVWMALTMGAGVGTH